MTSSSSFWVTNSFVRERSIAAEAERREEARGRQFVKLFTSIKFYQEMSFVVRHFGWRLGVRNSAASLYRGRAARGRLRRPPARGRARKAPSCPWGRAATPGLYFSNFYSNFYSDFWQTLRGSFSAVSKPNFASKYSFESCWRDLQDVHAVAPLSIQKVSQISSNVFACLQCHLKKSPIFPDSCLNFTNLDEHWKFAEILAFWFLRKTILKHQNLLDSQISRDFATEIVEFSEDDFPKVKKIRRR